MNYEHVLYICGIYVTVQQCTTHKQKCIIVHKIEIQKSPKSKWKPESEVLKTFREMTKEKREKKCAVNQLNL